MSGYADATRSIEYALLSSFFSRDGELAPELVAYFGSFEQVISYLFDPDDIFANNLRRAGVRNLIVGSPKITDQEHAARQLARPLERLALYLDDPAAIIAPNESRKVDPSLIALHPGSGSETKTGRCNTGQRWRNRCLRLRLVGACSSLAERLMPTVSPDCAPSCLTTGCDARRTFPWWNWRRVCRTARFSSDTTAASRIWRPRSERLLCFSLARLIRRSGRPPTGTSSAPGRQA